LFRKQKICAPFLSLISQAVNLGLAQSQIPISEENQMLKKLVFCAILAISAMVLNSAGQYPPHCTPGAPDCVAVNG